MTIPIPDSKPLFVHYLSTKIIQGLTLATWFLFISVGVTRILFGGFYFLNPRNVYWFGIDNTSGYIAQLFYIDDKWRFPLLSNPNYGGPLTSSPTFTGPSPLLVLFQKISGIEASFQLFGFWIVFNVFLQLVFAFFILRYLNFTKKISAVYAVFFVSPFLLFRITMHFWLISHFLILWALWILIKTVKSDFVSKKEIFSLFFIGYLLNIYLLLIAFSVVIVAQLVEARLRNVNSRKFFIKFIFKRACSLFVFAVVTFLTFDGVNRQSTAYESIKMYFSSTYGKHPFNLLSLVNPNTGLVAEGFPSTEKRAILHFSISPLDLGMTKGSYEGFSYVGLGTILMAVVVLVSIRNRWVNITKFVKRTEIEISIMGFLLIAIFSISNRICFGRFELSIPINLYLKWILGFARASGRFIWPVAYLIILLAILGALRTIKQWHLSRVFYFLLISLFPVVQLFDLALPLQNRDAVIKQVAGDDFRRDASIDYIHATARYREIRAWPQGDVLLNHYAELDFAAWSAGQNTDLIFTSRLNMRELFRRELETYNEICFGSMQPYVLYAVTKSRSIDLDSCPGKRRLVFVSSTHVYYSREE